MKLSLLGGTLLGLVILAGPGAALSAEALARDVDRVESVREIKNLQKTFAQLSHYGRFSDMGALFADDGVLRWGSGNGNILDNSDARAITGPAAIEAWLRREAGDMDGVQPGSLHAFLMEQPLVSLSVDGRSAKGRWHGLKFLGDGRGGTRIQGGTFENEYVRAGERWKISLLRFYPMFLGDYKAGWKNPGGKDVPIIPYHFTPDSAGTPILLPDKSVTNETTVALSEMAYRISQLNDEDEVRNLQHSYGFYVDRRMWTDVVDLFASDGTVKVDGLAYTGPVEIRKALEKMGPENLSEGVMNERPQLMTVVEVGASGSEATSRGFELGLIGNRNTKTGSWEFNIFRNSFVKDPNTGAWKFKTLELTSLIHAEYGAGWGNGGILPPRAAGTAPPAFLNVLGRGSSSRKPANWQPFFHDGLNTTAEQLSDLRRRLGRSSAFDETENVSAAYGWYADDIICANFAGLFAANGSKESPGWGFFQTPKRIEKACSDRYGPGSLTRMRGNVPFHWRPQPVIIVSSDGKSSSLRARNLQTGTSKEGPSGFSGLWGFNGGMYQDQFVLEEKDGASHRRLWSLVIDEFYWQSTSWAGGWASVGNATTPAAPSGKGKKAKRDRLATRQRGGNNGDPPDLDLKHPKLTERESGFNGGPTATVAFPRILRMWFAYRNPVSGRVPESYWAPGCVPCRTARPDWALTANGFQEPPTGPTRVTATLSGATVAVVVTGGPEEHATGVVELRSAGPGAVLLGRATLTSSGTASLSLPGQGADVGLAVYYLGNDRLKPGRTTVSPAGFSS